MLAPGLRLGWLTAAQPIVEQLALIKQRADPHTQQLVQVIVADMIGNGTFDAHLSELRTEHRRRRDALVAALERHGAGGHLQWTTPDGGLYLWCSLSGRIRTADVFAPAIDESVAFVRGEAFYVDHAGDRELRLCFSSIPASRADEVARRLLRAVVGAPRGQSGPAPLVAIV